MFTRENFLLSRGRKFQEVPFADGTLRIRSLTVGEREDLERGGFDPETGERLANSRFRQRLLVLSICGPDGEPLLTDEDLTAIGDMPAVDVEPVVDAVLALNRMGEKYREAAVKN